MTEFRTPFHSYDVLAKWSTPSWDEQTREVIGRRLTDIPPRRFFNPVEWEILEAVALRLVPQPERPAPIPIAPWIDEKLHHDRGDGFRYDDMPPMREAWRLGLQGVHEESQRLFRASFTVLSSHQQDAVLRAIQDGTAAGGVWEQLPPQRFFTTVLLKEVVGAYYSHPAAWSETGFGGPASPRGYVRLGMNQRDPWEPEARGVPDSE